MELTTWTLITIICFGLYYYFKKNHRYFEDYGIPYLQPQPLFGNMTTAIFRRKHISQLMRDIYNVNADAKYVGAFDFTRPIILLRDPELIKTVTIKNFDNFPDHQIIFDETSDPLFGSNLFNIGGDKWKEARSLLSPAFTSSKMKGMHDLMVDCGKHLADYVIKRPAKERQMVDTKELFTKYTNDVIASCAFGIKVDSLNDPKNDFFVYGSEATKLDGIQTIKFFLARSFPLLIRVFKIRFVKERIAKFFTDIISMTIKTRDEKGISRPDMLQLMMDARGKVSKNLKLDITEMTAQAFIFFFGGFDSTSTQMCLIAHELAINPDIQKKLQDEIDQVMKDTNGKPTYEAINGMAYLDAIFNESMRRHTQASFLDRLCTKEFELPPTLPDAKPFVVKPGMNIWISPTAIHMDTKYYDNPDKFDPDRYYQKKVTINDVNNLGFGIGPRSCIGNRFAILETKILFFFLLSKCNLKPNAKTCSPLRYSKQSFSLKADGGFNLSIEPRS